MLPNGIVWEGAVDIATAECGHLANFLAKVDNLHAVALALHQLIALKVEYYFEASATLCFISLAKEYVSVCLPSICSPCAPPLPNRSK